PQAPAVSRKDEPAPAQRYANSDPISPIPAISPSPAFSRWSERFDYGFSERQRESINRLADRPNSGAGSKPPMVSPALRFAPSALAVAFSAQPSVAAEMLAALIARDFAKASPLDTTALVNRAQSALSADSGLGQLTVLDALAPYNIKTNHAATM